MLDQGERAAILELHGKGMGSRAIARAMGLSRGVVRKVIRAGVSAAPAIRRAEKGEPHREEILELYERCEGNLVRVHEELVAGGARLSYPALTGFCRRHGIGQEPKVAVGRYAFAPGEEMQHDTSPHTLRLGERMRRVQTASLVLCYSRMLFFQFYPRFRRFDCKVFLTEALRYLGGACGVCLIDNTHVVVLHGTGREMVPVPEMVAFAERYGFEFRAHEKGDANRSGRVERPFDFIEGNFLAGRSFRDWEDANGQARAWCDKVNASPKRHLRASPRDLFACEKEHLRPLPAWVPPVYLLHQRIVDVEGYVCVDTNRYSVPDEWIGRRVEVRETSREIEVYEGPRRIAIHTRVAEPVGQRSTLPEHRRPRGTGPRRREPSFEEESLQAKAPELSQYVQELKRRSQGRGTLALRRLLRMVNDYPREPLLSAVQTARQYGLYDLERLERMVLQSIAQEYFELDPNGGKEGDDDGEG
jgi:transposase